MIKRFLASVLVIIMIISMAVSCKNQVESPNEPSDSSNAVGNVTDPVTGEETTTTIEPPPPKEPDFLDGRFDILAWEQTVKEYEVESPDGDSVDLAIYERNRKFEEEFETELVFSLMPGDPASSDAFVQASYTSIVNNSGTYDAIAAYSLAAGRLSACGVYEDLYGIDPHFGDYIWASEIIEESTVGGKLFYASGDIATSMLYQMNFLIINENYAKGLKIDVGALQKTALDGKFTLDKLFEVCDNAYLEYDNKPGKTAGDRFGLYLNDEELADLFFVGAGLAYVANNDKYDLCISDDYVGSESVGVLTKLADQGKKSNAYYTKYSTVGIKEGNSLVYAVKASDIVNHLKDAEYEYAVLPAPKYSEDQEDYRTALGFYFSMYSIPVDAPNKETSLDVLDYLSRKSLNVTQAVFEDVFASINNEDEDVRMLWLIRKGVCFDLGKMYYSELGGNTNSPLQAWRNCVISYSAKLWGHYVRNESDWNQKLEEIYNALTGAEK